jgi:predicted DNA binding protein
MLELLRMDFEKGVKVVLLEVTLFSGVTLEDIKWPKNVKVTVLTQVGEKYIMIFTFKAPNRLFKKLISKSQADVIWTTPTKYKDGKGTLACIGNEDELKKILKGMKLFGKVKNVSYHRAVYQEHNILSVLTDKQKEILLAAKKLGYYDYPRKIDTAGLAAKVGISKATVVEHLRKAEGRLMGNILAGY